MKLTTLLAVIMAAGLVGLIGAGAFADDWPQFRGPDRNGISKETGLLKQWPDGGPKVLWTATGLGKGYGSAAIAAGTIYVCGDFGNECRVTALGLDGKTVKWTRTIGGTGGDAGGHPGARSTPTVDGDAVYCESPAGDVVCMDAKTGAVRWGKNLKEMFRGQVGQWAYAESVLIDGNNLICTPGGEATLAALNKKTGAVVWGSQGVNDPAGYASPMLGKVGAVRMISTLTARGVVAVNADNGKFLWRYDRPSNKVANCPSPVFYKDEVFCASGYGCGGGLVKVTASGAQQVWETKDMVNHHGGYVIINDHIYGFNEGKGGGWSCLDIKDGHVTWANNGVGKGSVIAADGMLYCFSEGWKMGLVKVDPTKFEMVSLFSVAKTGSGERSWAHPSIANGRLYLRDDDGMTCYDIKAGK